MLAVELQIKYGALDKKYGGAPGTKVEASGKEHYMSQ